MPFPAGSSTITLTGTLPVPAGGSAQSGCVVLTPSTVLVDSTQKAIYSGAGTAALDPSGAFTMEVLCTDDPDVQPAGWRWRVDEQPAGGQRRTYWIDLPSTLGATVDLSALAPVSDPGGSGQSLPPTGPAGGALTGAYPNPQLSASTVSSFDAAGSADSAPAAAEAYTDTVAATKADLAGATFTGPVSVDGADLSISGTGKAYRLRRGGGLLDFEGAGVDLILSMWENGDFTGTQHTYDRYSAATLAAQHAGRREFVDAVFGTVRHVIDPTADQLGFHGATPVARQTVTGSRSDGTALASLLTALANLGLIVDNSTA